MNIRSFQKYAQEKKPEIKILKLWQDDYSNLIVSFELLGRKHAVLGKTPSGRGDWTLLYGIGAAKKTTDMPAGRGDYLVGNKMEAGLSTQLDEELSLQDVAIDFIKNKQGISWSPKNKTELENLSKLIQKSGEINSYLSEIGILYTGGDKLIYGEDITPEDILSWKIPEGKGIQIKELFAPQSARMGRERDTSGSGQQASGDTTNVTAFIPFLKEEFRAVFGRDLNKISTFRNAIQQAEAMRFPLASGDYDKLYSRIGPAADQIKALISVQRYEEAAKIIERSSLVNGSHMVGKAIDAGFNSNGLKTSDYDKFNTVVQNASKKSGIPARLNFEKSNHFHINVG